MLTFLVGDSKGIIKKPAFLLSLGISTVSDSKMPVVDHWTVGTEQKEYLKTIRGNPSHIKRMTPFSVYLCVIEIICSHNFLME